MFALNGIQTNYANTGSGEKLPVYTESEQKDGGVMRGAPTVGHKWARRVRKLY
jgi:hypothetical protein